MSAYLAWAAIGAHLKEMDSHKRSMSEYQYGEAH
jgi:hypothetical protein